MKLRAWWAARWPDMALQPPVEDVRVNDASALLVLAGEYHSGRPCDCYRPDQDRPLRECWAWAANILDALNRAGHEVTRGALLARGVREANCPECGHSFDIEIERHESWCTTDHEGGYRRCEPCGMCDGLGCPECAS